MSKFNYFARGLGPRTDRRNVHFRIGQQVEHVVQKYKGVVIGWDRTGQAPDAWFDTNNVPRRKQSQPFYQVMTRRAPGAEPEIFYVMQENLASLHGSGSLTGLTAQVCPVCRGGKEDKKKGGTGGGGGEGKTRLRMGEREANELRISNPRSIFLSRI